ncbi:uncharacterized protein [Dermacentor albipictus]|uniref:uncharacterized protein n=1 Tax=Dermacentor albipictus TaxID=60249 RepID=UPI0038FC2577
MLSDATTCKPRGPSFLLGRMGDITDFRFVDKLLSRITSSAELLQRQHLDTHGLRGHGTRLRDSMAEKLLLVLQVTSWFSGTAITWDGLPSCLPYHLYNDMLSDATTCKQRGPSFLLGRMGDITDFRFVDKLLSRITSSAELLQRQHLDTHGLRGHGTRLRDSMAEKLLLVLQVGSWPDSISYRSDDRLLVVLPCPRRCRAILVDCWSVMLLLLTSGDIEENPGPLTEKYLKAILDNQAETDRKLNSIQEQIGVLSARTEKLSDYLVVIQEMTTTIDKLEDTVRQQAKKLVEFENRGRRNNLLVFGVPEKANETESDLRAAVVDNIFKKELGVHVTTIERIHLLVNGMCTAVYPVSNLGHVRCSCSAHLPKYKTLTLQEKVCVIEDA